MRQIGGLSPTAQGAVLVLLCMSVIGLIDNFIPIIAQEAGLWQFLLVRSIMVCTALAGLVLVFGWRLKPRSWRAVMIRSVLGGLSMAIYFGALAALSIAQVGAGLFMAPVLVLLFSVLLFRQTIGVWRVAAALIGFGGVLLVLRPDTNGLTVLTLLPMAAGVTWALTALTTRHLCEQESTISLVFGFFVALGAIGAAGLIGVSVFGAPESWHEAAPFFAQGWVTPSAQFLFWVAMQALGAMIGIGCLTRAYQIGETSYVAVFEYSFLIFASFWAWVIWSDHLDAVALAGIATIILSGAVIALRTRDA
ncbi:MAG: DMT family transporter [Rhodobacteraceae bacterium]|nr:DMT family transporter [Paracoccaceae bacterium]